MSTDPTIAKHPLLAQIQNQTSNDGSDNNVIMTLPCGGRTKSTRAILALLRQQDEAFHRTAFVTDNEFMELFTPLLEEAKNLKRDSKSNGKRINWSVSGNHYGTAMAAHNKRLQDNQGLLFLSPMPSHDCIRKFRYKLDGDKPMRQRKGGAGFLEIVPVEHFVDCSNDWQARQTFDEGECLCHRYCNYILTNTTFGAEFLDLCFEKCQYCEPCKPRAKRPKCDTLPIASPWLGMSSTETSTQNAIEAKDSTVNQTTNTANTTKTTNSNNGNHSQVFQQTNLYFSATTPVSAAIQLARYRRKVDFLEKFIRDNGLAVPEFTDEDFPFQEGFHTPAGAYSDLDPPTSAADPAIFHYSTPARHR